MAKPSKTTVSLSVEEAAFQSTLAFDQELVAPNMKTLMNRLSASKGEQLLVLPEDIHVLPDFNVRTKGPEYTARVRFIADSMKARGFNPSKPLSVIAGILDGKPVIYVVDGHTRLDAAILAISEDADIEYIPIVLSDKSTTMEDLTVELVVGNTGEKLKPLEMAIACKRLVKFGWSEERIAGAFGITSKYVGQLLTVVGAPSAIRKMVDDGTVPFQIAYETIGKYGNDAVAYLSGELGKAKAHGASKITKAGINGRALPKKIVASYVESVEMFTGSLSKTALTQIKQADQYTPESLVGVKVEVDLAALLALLEPQQAAADFRAKQVAKAAAKETIASEASA